MLAIPRDPSEGEGAVARLYLTPCPLSLSGEGVGVAEKRLGWPAFDDDTLDPLVYRRLHASRANR